MASNPAMDSPTRVSVAVRFPLTTQSTFGVTVATPNEKVEYESAKVATASGRRTTNLKTPIDSIHFQFHPRGVAKEGIPTALLSYV